MFKKIILAWDEHHVSLGNDFGCSRNVPVNLQVSTIYTDLHGILHGLPSGKRGTHNELERFTMLLMGKSSISMAIFNSYVKLPEGSLISLWILQVYQPSDSPNVGGFDSPPAADSPRQVESRDATGKALQKLQDRCPDTVSSGWWFGTWLLFSIVYGI